LIAIELLYKLIDKPISGEWGTEGGSIKVIRTANFTNHGVINFSKVVNRDIADKKVTAKKLQVGDIIIEKSGGSPDQPVGRVVYFDKEDTFLCNNFTSILRPKKGLVFPKYLHYILFCNHKFGFVKKYQNKTTGIINLQLPRYIQETEIPLPPLSEQKKIAEILDAADSLRQKDQQLVEHYDRLSQSLFLNMFGEPSKNPYSFNLKSFSSVVKNCNSLRVPIKQADRAEMQGSYPYYGATGIVDHINDFKLDGQYLLIAEDGKNLVNRKKPLAWCVNGQFWVNNHAHVVEFNGVCNLVYLEYLLSNMDISSYVTGIDQFKMNKSNLNRIPIMLPELEKQEQFEKYIVSIQAQKKLAQQGLKKSNDLFNSLLQRAFKGELTDS
jgi:type I restriction enzyme S subunit